jgi:hypothetical protein
LLAVAAAEEILLVVAVQAVCVQLLPQQVVVAV